MPNIKLESLLLAAVSLIFLPMIIYAAYLAFLAFGEGERLRSVQAMPLPEKPLAGQLYAVKGAVGGELLSPGEFPEIRGALQWRAQRQTRSDTLSDNWVDDGDTDPRTQQAKAITVGGVAVALSETARIVAPIREAFHQDTPTSRWHLYYREATGLNFVLFGYYEHGVLKEGSYDRLLLLTSDQVSASLAAVSSAGRLKAAVLAVISAVLAGLGALSLRASLKGTTGRRAFRPV